MIDSQMERRPLAPVFLSKDFLAMAVNASGSNSSATLQAQDLAKRNTLSHIDTFGKRLKVRFERVGYKGEIGGTEVLSE